MAAAALGDPVPCADAAGWSRSASCMTTEPDEPNVIVRFSARRSGNVPGTSGVSADGPTTGAAAGCAAGCAGRDDAGRGGITEGLGEDGGADDSPGARRPVRGAPRNEGAFPSRRRGSPRRALRSKSRSFLRGRRAKRARPGGPVARTPLRRTATGRRPFRSMKRPQASASQKRTRSFDGDYWANGSDANGTRGVRRRARASLPRVGALMMLSSRGRVQAGRVRNGAPVFRAKRIFFRRPPPGAVPKARTAPTTEPFLQCRAVAAERHLCIYPPTVEA
jgi:hypothetical protein